MENNFVVTKYFMLSERRIFDKMIMFGLVLEVTDMFDSDVSKLKIFPAVSILLY